jgi:hypothetical protein
MGAYPIGTFCITRFAHIGSFNQQYCNNAGWFRIFQKCSTDFC